jgi:AraC family transcriptional regulator
MADDADTLGFGMTYGMVAVRTACGQLVSLSHSSSHDRVPPHKHINDYVCIVVAGGFAEHSGDSWRDRPAGSFFVHRAGETHRDEFGPAGATCLSLHFDTAQGGPQLEGACSRSTRVAVDTLAFELVADSRDELAVASLSAEIMSSLESQDDVRHDRGSWIDHIVEAISEEPVRRWSLRELAEIAGRHPVHVAKSFREKTGISLGAFQRLRRLTRLSLALRKEQTPLAMLATDFGYCDQAHMNAEFRAAFGMSPGKFRRDVH